MEITAWGWPVEAFEHGFHQYQRVVPVRNFLQVTGGLEFSVCDRCDRNNAEWQVANAYDTTRDFVKLCDSCAVSDQLDQVHSLNVDISGAPPSRRKKEAA